MSINEILAKNPLPLEDQFLVAYFNSQQPCLGDAFVIYEMLAKKGYTQSGFSSELHDRLIGNPQTGFVGAVIKGTKVFCSVHLGHKLESDGSCSHCQQAENEYGMDVAEARAMRLAEQVYENDDFFERAVPAEESLAGENTLALGKVRVSDVVFGAE